MEDVIQIRKAFREAVNSGLKMLEEGKINWEQYSFAMLGFEAKLQSMGERF